MSGTKRTLAEETPKEIDKKVTLCGWVKTRRDHGKLIFVDLLDRTGIVQIVFNPKASSDAYKKGDLLKPQCVVEIEGIVKKRPEGTVNKDEKTGEVEILAEKIEIIAEAETLPFDMGSTTLNLELPTLLDHRSLTLRHQSVSPIFKIQEKIVESFRKTLKKEEFTEIFVPTIVRSATEGGAEVFGIDYYDHKAYLAQSPQFYKQIMVGVYERVFTVAHAFRAEPSTTTRHLSEYVSLDAEMGFIDSWEDLMDMVEIVVLAIIKDVGNSPSELANLGVQPLKLPREIPRLKLREAQEIIFKRTGKDNRKEPDLDPKDEKEICKWAEEEKGAPFVFITHYPTSKRPFYTMPDPNEPEYTLSFDLLGVSEEWVTGGQRINDYKTLSGKIKKMGGNLKDFELYLEAFRFGMPSEGGFAMGLERITKGILGLSNIREASLFPRDMERIDERLSS